MVDILIWVSWKPGNISLSIRSRKARKHWNKHTRLWTEIIRVKISIESNLSEIIDRSYFSHEHIDRHCFREFNEENKASLFDI